MSDDFYDELTVGALELASTWDAVAYHCGDPTPMTSQCAQEAAALPSRIDAPERLMRAITQDAAVYVTAATQHLRSLARLMGPEIVLSGWSVTRTLAEHCGRAAWLLGPDATPTGRVARYYMERIVSLHIARLATEQIGNRRFAKELRKNREALLRQAEQIFPGTKLFEPEELNDWEVGGEPYAGLGKAVNAFGRDSLGGKALYDVLSTYTHPSLYRLSAQTKVTQLEDRLHHGYVAEPEVIQWQFAVASGSVYRAAHHVVGYLGIDDAPLEHWAEGHRSLLATAT